MAEVASAYVTLIPSAKGFGSKIQSEIGGSVDKAGVDGGKRYAKGMGGAISAGLKGVVSGIGLALAGGAAVGFLKDSVAEARESQKVGALTAQVIKTTGGAAKVTAGQVGDLAASISNKTGIDDEAIQSASNLLLTFTNLRNEVGKGNNVFDQATQIATDMGAALGTEPKAAAIQLGKALNDPIKGVTALQRVGVSFTEQQKKTIKSLVKQGDTLGAQKLILGELNKEFGGAAAASSTAGEKASVAFGNLKEQIGTALLPVIDKVANFLTTKVVPAISQFVAGVQDGTGAGGRFAAVVRAIASRGTLIARILGIATAAWVAFRVAAIAYNVAGMISLTILKAQTVGTKTNLIVTKTAAIASKAWAAAQWLINAALTANPIGIVVVAIAALVAGMVIAYKHSETFRDIVDGAFKAVAAAGKFLWDDVLKPVFRFIVDAWMTVAGAIINGAASAFGWVPGLGPKLKAAAAKFNEFRDSVNTALAGTKNRYELTILTPGAREANRQLADLLYKTQHMPKSVTIGVTNKLAGIPGRATGGPVTAGQAYVVGERRPELFVPNQSGRIIPRVPTSGGAVRLHPYDIAAIAEAVSASPIYLDGRQVSKSQGRSLMVGVMA